MASEKPPKYDGLQKSACQWYYSTQPPSGIPSRYSTQGGPPQRLRLIVDLKPPSRMVGPARLFHRLATEARREKGGFSRRWSEVKPIFPGVARNHFRTDFSAWLYSAESSTAGTVTLVCELFSR